MSAPWQQTACILCSVNCGIEVQLDGRRLARIRGDKAHPASQGYACEKAQKLDHYQNDPQRLTAPLRRRADGSFETIDWDTAIAEVAGKLRQIRDTLGGEKIFYYGGGGQGNHLGGGYGSATRKAFGSVYTSNALAQEKTGEFWVDGQLFGRPRCHTCGDFEHAEVALFIGKNPWQSHGFPRARVVLKQIAADPQRTLIVIDPRRTETAELADIHLAVRPGGDAFCLSALLGVLVQEGLVNQHFLAEHTSHGEQVLERLSQVNIDDYAARAGLPAEDIRRVARLLASARSLATYEDLGIQQAPHSTLNSYLEKLLYLLTGNFARPGTMNIHTRMAGLGGGSSGGRKSPVTGQRIITGLIPCNAIADEILTDHPDRFRAMIVESANPAHSLADSVRMREALQALDLLVVIDVAMSETARQAHYVLPPPSQFEKWEATFFNLEFPANVFQLRAPILDPTPGTMPEPELHCRLVRASGVLDGLDLTELHAAAARGRSAFAEAFLMFSAMQPQWAPYAPVILYETLGPTLGAGRQATAAIWGVAHTCAMTYPESVRRAGFEGEGFALGEALFEAIMSSRSGIVFTVDEYTDTWQRLATADGRINLAIPELLAEFDQLPQEPTQPDPRFPLVLTAGERRSITANTIYRNPAWRRQDREGSLLMSPQDAQRLGVAAGGRVRLSTARGSVEAAVEISPRMQAGHISLPNGLGLVYPDDQGRDVVHGIAPNELTSSEHRDWLAGTPLHKHVPARVEVLR